MAKKITQDYVLNVEAKGLSSAAKNADNLKDYIKGLDESIAKSSKTTTAFSKSMQETDRNIKGVGQSTNNTTRAFSKMSQGMTGVLVPAYATVAANIFALTATFNALRQAADFEVMINSAEKMGEVTGASLITVGKELQQITGYAINLKDALDSATLATSAGFDTSTIKELTMVAKNASVALGRDLTDSMNRVFKGAIKAEPELLDELGIILRLDDASREYAASIGKTAKELTTFQKQQAVVNAVIEQGTKKFAQFAEIDTNPYNKLAASFQDISKEILSLANISVIPIFEFFAENTQAMTAALILFSTTVVKRAIPGLQLLGEELGSKLVTSLRTVALSLKKQEVLREFNSVLGNSLKDTNSIIEYGLRNINSSIDQFSVIKGKLAKSLSEKYNNILNVANFKTQADRLQAVTRAINADLERYRVSLDLNKDKNKQIVSTLTELSAATDRFSGATNSVVSSLGTLGITANNTFIRLKNSLSSFSASISTLKGFLGAGFFGGLKGGIKGIKELAKRKH